MDASSVDVLLPELSAEGDARRISRLKSFRGRVRGAQRQKLRFPLKVGLKCRLGVAESLLETRALHEEQSGPRHCRDPKTSDDRRGEVGRRPHGPPAGEERATGAFKLRALGRQSLFAT